MTSLQTPVDSRRLLALAKAGYSQRWIARRLGLKPTFVRQRLNQLLREAAEESAEKQAHSELESADLPAHLLPEDDTPPGFNPSNIRRCQGCGSLVYLWPCLSCQMAAEAAAKSVHK